MFRLKDTIIVESLEQLANIPDGKTLINTINAFSYNNAQKDPLFAEALTKGDYLLPDGMSIVKACKRLKAISRPIERIAGWDFFSLEMNKLEERGKQLEEEALKLGKEFVAPCAMFMGSSDRVLYLIKEKSKIIYPHLRIATYSPPYKKEFSAEDDRNIIDAIHNANPDLLWIGMTAPKQEKWTYEHWKDLNIHCHVGTIGAVFDFFAGTTERAPEIWQKKGYEWLYRLIKEPKRMWRRYVIGNPEFLFRILKEKFC